MLKEKLKLVPNNPGCYLMKDESGNIIYVGKAKNLFKRVNSYFNKVQTGKTLALVNQIRDFDYIITNTEVECLILEINLIKKYSPKYNILLKDDKTYPYILLTNDKYPMLKIVRKKSRKNIKGKLFGPYPNVTSARNTVSMLNRIYPLRKCEKLKKDVCLYYHINECLGYCKYDIPEEKISEMTKEISDVLNGNYKVITTKLEEKMNSYSDALEYEKALDIKNMIDDIKSTINKQIIVSNTKYNFDVFGYYEKNNFLVIEVLNVRGGIILGKTHKIFEDVIDYSDVYFRYIIDYYEKHEITKEIVINDIIDKDILSSYLNTSAIIPVKGDVKRILNLANENALTISKEKVELIKRNNEEKELVKKELCNILNIFKVDRIELFDNSHLFGTFYVAGLVVFDNLEPNKKEYRKYKISEGVKDDLAAMKEVVYRRYYRLLVENGTFPDVLMVDGGRNQVVVAKEIIDELHVPIKVIGLKKNDKHRTYSIINDTLEEIELSSSKLLLYLTKMQDEVHRFAITYHRNIKSKGSLSSLLENVKGIGEKRRKELLRKYSSIEKIKNADIDDLAKILTIDVAKDLKEYLNK